MGRYVGPNPWTINRGAVGEYFSGVGDSATLVTSAPEDTSWKKPWFAGLFVGTFVGISIGLLLKK